MEQIPVQNTSSYDPESSEYFKNLPAFVQETIMQSSGLINNEDELREAAERMLGNIE